MTAKNVNIDWDVVDLVAQARKESHDGTRRGDHKAQPGQDKTNMDRTGAAAEIAFAMRYDLRAPRVDLRDGDGGYDFCVEWGESERKVEIKSSDYRNPNLLVPSIRDVTAPDVYVLYSAKYCAFVRPVGWITTSELLSTGEKRDSKIGEYCHFVDSDVLRELPPKEMINQP